MAQNFQRASNKWEVLNMILAIFSLGSMAYYVMTGNELALAAWLFFSAMVWSI